MTEIESYCRHCGLKIEPTSGFCSHCGRVTPLAATTQAGIAAAVHLVTRKSISRDRATLAYIMGIFIAGTGHMVVGRVARGILILAGGMVIGFATGLIGGLILVLISAIAYWIFQMVDLSKQIHRMEVVKT